MKRSKTNTIIYILLILLFAILSLFATTTISKVLAQDEILDETTATVKVTTNGETSY